MINCGQAPSRRRLFHDLFRFRLNESLLRWLPCLFLAGLLLAASLVPRLTRGQATSAGTTVPAGELHLAKGNISIRVLAQSPAETDTQLQAICLFRSDPANQLHASLAEINEKLNGLLDQIRKPNLFAGETGETLLLTPRPGTLRAKALLLIGLGDSSNFDPGRMDMVGAIVYQEAIRLGVSKPYFAPTILDGGVSKFPTGQVAGRVLAGFARAARTDELIRDSGMGRGGTIQSLTFLAGATHLADTLEGIKRAIASLPAQ